MSRERPLDPTEPTSLLRCLRALDGAEPVVVPGDGSYLLAADALKAEGVDRVVEVTQREDPLDRWVVVGNVRGFQHVARLTPVGKRVLERHGPGEVVLRLPGRGTTPSNLPGEGGSVLVGIPGEAFLRRLAERFGPLVTVPASLRGEPHPGTCDAARMHVGDVAAWIVDAGPRDGEGPTVVDALGEAPKVIRPGVVPGDDLVAQDGR